MQDVTLLLLHQHALAASRYHHHCNHHVGPHHAQPEDYWGVQELGTEPWA